MNRWIMGLFLFLLLLSPWRAYAGNPQVLQCTGTDSVTTGTTPITLIIGGCGLGVNDNQPVAVTGPMGILYISVISQVVCNSNSSAQIFVRQGTQSIVNASNFGGDISGGVLTIPQYRPGSWYQNCFTTPPGSLICPGMMDGYGPATASRAGNGSATVGGASLGTSYSWKWVNPGQVITGNSVAPPPGITIQRQLTSAEGGGELGGAGTYQLSNSTAVSSDHANGYFAYTPPPGDIILLPPLMHQKGCKPGLLATKLTGIFHGVPNTSYSVGLLISTDIDGTTVAWDNGWADVFAY